MQNKMQNIYIYYIYVYMFFVAYFSLFFSFCFAFFFAFLQTVILCLHNLITVINNIIYMYVCLERQYINSITSKLKKFSNLPFQKVTTV